MSGASAELRPIEVIGGSPPLREEQEVNEGGAAAEADPDYRFCRTPTSTESKLPPAPPNCPPAPKKRKRKYWRGQRRRPPPPLELIAAEAQELEQLFQRRDPADDQPTTTQAKRMKVRDSDRGSC